METLRYSFNDIVLSQVKILNFYLRDQSKFTLNNEVLMGPLKFWGFLLLSSNARV